MMAFVLSYFCFVLSCFVMFGCYLLEACSFLKRSQGGADLRRRGGLWALGGVEGGETMVGNYCMRE